MRFSAIVLFFAVTAFGQKLSYFEGDVAVNGQTQTRNDGAVFAPGTTLSTTGGRIEIQLAPDVYARLGNQSSLRIVSDNALQLVIDSVRANSVNVEMRVGDSVERISKPGEYEFGAEPDSLLSIWSTNRRIRLFSRLTGSTQPEQPLIGPNTDLTAGISASVGLIPLTGIPQLMYQPIRPYRPGSQFFGPSYAYWYPYYSYPPTLRPPGPQRFRPVMPTPSIGLRPGVTTFNGGLHIPGPVIGH